MTRQRIPADLAAAVKMVVFDVDGVLTDGGLYIGETGEGVAIELKRFEITDGLGVKLLQKAGLLVYIVSGRPSRASHLRAQELGAEYYEAPHGFKLEVVERLRGRHGVEWSEVACICDDLADLPILQRCGLPVAVANAVPEVVKIAKWQTQRSGGRGAAREFVEEFLEARGVWTDLVDAYCAERGGVAREA